MSRRLVRCRLAVDVRLGHETARQQRLGAIKLGLRQIGIGLCRADLCRERSGLLNLHITVDHRQRLTRRYPLARLDQNAGDLSALSRNANRHFPAGSDGAIGRDQPCDILSPGNHHGDIRRGRRASGIAVGVGRRFVGTKGPPCPGKDQCQHEQPGNQHSPTSCSAIVGKAVARATQLIHRLHLCFVVHGQSPSASRNANRMSSHGVLSN